MADFSRRLARMEAVASSARRDRYRAHRAAMARAFEDEGDPRDDEAFYRLTPELQKRLAWLYDAWKLTPSGFVKGMLPLELAPEPTPHLLFIRPPAEPEPWAQAEWTSTDNG